MKKISIGFILLLLLSGCSGKETAHEHEEEDELHNHVSGDLQERTANKDVLPNFLEGQNETIRQTYSIVANYAEVLDSVPCYCGCGDSVGHRSNTNCFITERYADGSITWDDHGTRCNVCIEIALQAAKMASDGKELKEIRETIDNLYQEGYASSTKTDMPA